ncbi:MAG: GNAT family N-acetyltransferase [Sarcina sp.]
MFDGTKVILREYKASDVVIAHRYINDYSIARTLTEEAIFPISIDEEEEFINNNKSNEKMTYNFAIEDLETSEYIGGCGINSTDLKNRICTIGIFIGDMDYWGQGYATDALEILINFIFNELNLEKIKLTVYDFNTRAIKLYEHLGFKVEGVLKREVFREGKYHDKILMAMFREDYF